MMFRKLGEAPEELNLGLGGWDSTESGAIFLGWEATNIFPEQLHMIFV